MRNNKIIVIGLALMMALAGCNSMVADNTSFEEEEIGVTRIEYSQTALRAEGKKIEDLKKTGLSDPFLCNLDANIKREIDRDSAPVLVCKDPIYGITYYVNYGRDYFIYAYNNRERLSVVDIPASHLFCKDGELYFLAKTYGLYEFDGFSDGNIMKYDPRDGKVTVVVDCNADSMIVYQDGICYCETGSSEPLSLGGEIKSVKVDNSFFSFADKKSSRIPILVDTFRRWNGFLLKGNYEIVPLSKDSPLNNIILPEGLSLAGVSGGLESIDCISLTGETVFSLNDVEDVSKYYWMYDNQLYYIAHCTGEVGSQALMVYDMQTGERTKLDVLRCETNDAYTDMMLLDGVIRFSNCLRVDLVNGEQSYLQKVDQGSVNIKRFYTDGEKIFCLSGGRIWLYEELKGTSTYSHEFEEGLPLTIGDVLVALSEP